MAKILRRHSILLLSKQQYVSYSLLLLLGIGPFINFTLKMFSPVVTCKKQFIWSNLRGSLIHHFLLMFVSLNALSTLKQTTPCVWFVSFISRYNSQDWLINIWEWKSYHSFILFYWAPIFLNVGYLKLNGIKRYKIQKQIYISHCYRGLIERPIERITLWILGVQLYVITCLTSLICLIWQIRC